MTAHDFIKYNLDNAAEIFDVNGKTTDYLREHYNN